jgi:hypothetical protein
LAALALVVILPGFAQAQLFPNRNIRRERPPCASEPPFYGQVRRDYFGYFPTCWSKFPEGWGCPNPNPEAPDLATAMEDIRKKAAVYQPNLEDPGLGTLEDPMTPRTEPGMDPAAPALPPAGRSPFDIDRPDGTGGPAPGGLMPGARPNPANPGAAAPGAGPGAAGGLGPNSALPPSSRRSLASAFNGSNLPEMPSLPAPSIRTGDDAEAGAMALPAEATLASSNPENTRPDLGPLPSLPPTNPGPMTGVHMASGTMAPPSTPTDAETVLGAPPAQAPRRRSILGGLFDSLGTRRR